MCLTLLKTHRRAIPSYLTRFLESFLKMKRATGCMRLVEFCRVVLGLYPDHLGIDAERQIAYSNVGPSVLPFADREVSVFLITSSGKDSYNQFEYQKRRHQEPSTKFAGREQA